ncbi:hypothetical protein, partial [Streptomyces durocortorensis]
GDDHRARDDDPDEYAVRACQLHRGHLLSPAVTRRPSSAHDRKPQVLMLDIRGNISIAKELPQEH